MIERIFAANLQRKLKNFPIVAIVGARQCGKTTLARSALDTWNYIDCEKLSEAARLQEDPEARLNQLGPKTIFDEAQRAPDLFPLLRGYVDENRSRNGQFVLLGSVSLSLIKQISESLSGRVAFVEMTPFLFCEVAKKSPENELSRLWLRGGYPDAFLAGDSTARLDWNDGYVRTFIERDLAAYGVDVSPIQMNKIMTMNAHVNAQQWNASQIAASLGISYKTVNRYLDILEQTFLLRRLQPYFTNIGKRLTKSPKLFFRDTGLLHFFLGITTMQTLNTHPNRGASWEAFVIEQLITLYSTTVPGSRFWYWRTAAGVEVDLLVESEGNIIPFEIKLHSAPSKAMVPGLLSCMKDLGLSKGYVLYPGDTDYSIGQGMMVLSVGKVLADAERVKVL
jgi:predicted AAA+ superfamily ATPase